MPKNSQAKAKALRVPLDSCSGDRLARNRNALTIIAIVACVGWLVAGHFSNKEIARRYSPGPISNAHAHLGCNACHADSAPLRNATFLSQWKKKAGDESQLWHRKSDRMCTTCHPVIGGGWEFASFNSTANYGTNNAIAEKIPVHPHASNQKIETVDSCASCHSEHLGFDHSPSQVSDKSCIECHQDLAEFRTDDERTIHPDITNFEANHPPFRGLEKDSGVLLFNHELHMSIGLVKDGDNQVLAKTVAELPQLSEFAMTDGKIKLTCGFCHQPIDRPGFGPTELINMDSLSANSGKYMSMPSYEQNCQVCHKIDLIPRSEVDETGTARFKTDFNVKELRIKHGATSKQILEALNVYFSLEAFTPADMREEFADQGIDMRQELPTRLWDFTNPDTDISQDIRDDLETAKIAVRNKCLKCHLNSELATEQDIFNVQTMPTSITKSNQVYETAWFKLGMFDHSAHRDVNCAQCHVNDAGKSDKPMIKGRDNCIECHQSATKVVSPSRPGPTNCTSCHTYHGGGNRMVGLRLQRNQKSGD